MAKNRCLKTIFDRKTLCIGTMQDYIKILSRELGETEIGQTQAREQFINVYENFGALEAVRPTERFAGINIDKNITHIVYMSFDQTVYELDINTLFVEIEKNRNRLFKLKKIMDYGESETWMALYLTETGFSDLEASEG